MSNIDRLAKLRKLKTGSEQSSPDSLKPEQEALVPEASAIASEETTSSPLRLDREKSGWISPSYTVSRAVTLSPDTVTANRCLAFSHDSAAIDSYKILRTQILQRTKQSGGRSIMVTSARPGEGKTTTAINLALTFAKEFQQTVLLVDCDLQHQDIHRYLGYGSDSGLIDYLLDDKPVSELITWPGVEKLTIISGGRTIQESSELLGSPRMRELVADMKERYPERYVIFDVPGLLSGADALVFTPLVDHVLVVVQEGVTPLPDIQRAIAAIPSTKLLGLMLNRHKGAPVAPDPRKRAGYNRQDA
jgi:non-specific protein-tyrosine kinase